MKVNIGIPKNTVKNFLILVFSVNWCILVLNTEIYGFDQKEEQMKERRIRKEKPADELAKLSSKRLVIEKEIKLHNNAIKRSRLMLIIIKDRIEEIKGEKNDDISYFVNIANRI